jgi:hypothetical protein
VTTVKDLLQRFGELGGMLIVMDASLRSNNHEDIQGVIDGWDERLGEIEEFLNRQLDEVPSFGEAYD